MSMTIVPTAAPAVPFVVTYGTPIIINGNVFGEPHAVVPGPFGRCIRCGRPYLTGGHAPEPWVQR